MKPANATEKVAQPETQRQRLQDDDKADKDDDHGSGCKKTNGDAQQEFSVITLTGEEGEDLEIINLETDKQEDTNGNSSNSPSKQQEENSEVIFVKEGAATSSSSRKRKRSQQDPTSCLSNGESDEIQELDKDSEVIFLEYMKKSRTVLEVELGSSDDDKGAKQNANNDNDPQGSVKTTKPQSQNSRRHFLNPHEAASDLVDKLLKLGEKRVLREDLGTISEMEYYVIMETKYFWRKERLNQNVEENESEQDFCWRVRRFTRKTLLTLVRQMANHSALAWAILENNKEHVRTFIRQNNTESKPKEVKKDIIPTTVVKSETNHSNSNGTGTLLKPIEIKKEDAA